MPTRCVGQFCADKSPLVLAVETRDTKAVYSRSILAELDFRDRTLAYEGSFELAVRLLVESGDRAKADKLDWPTKLIHEYVQEAVVAHVTTAAGRYEGTRRERRKVAMDIFRAWLLIVSDERRVAADQMVAYIAECTQGEVGSSIGTSDIGGRALEILAEVAKKRPELRAHAADQVAMIIVSKLTPETFWQSKSKGLELALEYVDAFSDTDKTAVVEATLTLLAGVDPAAQCGQSPDRDATSCLCAGNEAMPSISGARQARSLNYIKVRNRTEHGDRALFFNLRDFDPDLLHDPTIINAVQPAVQKLRKEVERINSTAAAGNVQSLLLSPTISGRDGVKDALRALRAILQSADTK